jgi:signal transduction histidine kinase
MHVYLLAPLIACLISAICLTAILARDARHAVNRLSARVAAGCMFWSFCEVLWNTAPDLDVALGLIRLSGLGWIPIGPTFLELLIEATSAPAPRARRWLRVAYPGVGVLLLLALATPWMTERAFRTSWGVAYEPGPLMLAFYAMTSSSVFVALAVGRRAFYTSRSMSERRQARLLVIGILIPLVVASATDGILPMLGIQWPRFGTFSLAVLCAIITWSIVRYGYSVLAPGAFAGEVLATLPDGVALLHLDGRVRSANAGMARLLGCDLAEVEGLPLSGRIPAPILGATPLLDHECELQTPGRAPIPVTVSSSRLEDKQGAPFGIVLVVHDLREVVGLRRRLVTSDRLAAVGQLAAGIAHEINNPLAFARANLSVLRTEWAKLAAELRGVEVAPVSQLIAEGEELIEETLEGVDRAVAIVRDVKGFARAGDGAREPSDLHALLRNALRFATPQIGRGIEILEDLGSLPPVCCAPQEIEQVFLNLVVNAAQALGASGQLRITTRAQGSQASVTIEDDGAGIAPEVLDRIFDPFFTTKPAGEGTGLGLSISYEIVQRHGGDIDVESRIGEGTRFVVRLPLAAEGD